MLAAFAYTRGALARRLPSPRATDALFLLGAGVFAAMIVAIHRGSGTYWDGSALLFLWHGVVGAAVALMLYAAAAGSRVARAGFANAPLRYLGLVSFGLYLWHYPLIQWLGVAHAFDALPGYRLPWSLPVVLLLACGLADLSYRLVERPLLRVGRRVRHPGLTTEAVHAPD
jgi:peptidoglycan/LPS O-acetylase OafA/YrhL